MHFSDISLDQEQNAESFSNLSHVSVLFLVCLLLLFVIPSCAQCLINNSSKCSNCYGPRAFGGSRGLL